MFYRCTNVATWASNGQIFQNASFFCFVLLQHYTDVVTYYAFSRDNNALQVSHTDLTYNEIQQNSNNY